ncbi:MAG TPA: hypothetical protein VHX39_18690, partial [Acetobacteraceae bacterium]|nr:hypothetical protein [Acetobacteraceae bacterium]
MRYRLRLCAVAGAYLLTATISYAGSGNSLYLVQDGGAAGVNNFVSDQSQVDGSSIDGGSPLVPATQTGASNTAHLSFSCSMDLPCIGGTIALTQTSKASTAATNGNNASIAVRGGGNASVIQNGEGNSADMLLTGGDGNIDQQGSGNNAKLQVGAGVTGTILQ